MTYASVFSCAKNVLLCRRGDYGIRGAHTMRNILTTDSLLSSTHSERKRDRQFVQTLNISLWLVFHGFADGITTARTHPLSVCVCVSHPARCRWFNAFIGIVYLVEAHQLEIWWRINARSIGEVLELPCSAKRLCHCVVVELFNSNRNRMVKKLLDLPWNRTGRWVSLIMS